MPAVADVWNEDKAIPLSGIVLKFGIPANVTLAALADPALGHGYERPEGARFAEKVVGSTRIVVERRGNDFFATLTGDLSLPSTCHFMIAMLIGDLQAIGILGSATAAA